MSEKEFKGTWFSWAALIALIVAAVAGLLLAIIATAQQILANAVKALGLAKEIVENTNPIWNLQTTNEVVGELVEGARAIEEHATKLADTLETPAIAAENK
jgi:hypothetical protein